MTNADLYYDKMTKTPVSRLIIRLGIPTTVSMLITSIYNLADTYFVGTLGESPQAAIGILLTLQTIIQAVAFMLGHGVGTFVSKELANRDVDAASRYCSSAFFLGAAVGLVLMVGGLLFLDPLLLLLGSTDTILPYSKTYGFWVLLSCPVLVCSIILNNDLRYEGKALYAMIGLGFGSLLNIFGDWLLISKLGMGVYGAGLSTAVSQLVSFVILLFMHIKTAQSHIALRSVSRSAKTYLGILRVGLPSLIRQGLNSLSMGLLNNLTKPFGDAAIAAMSVVNRYVFFVVAVGLGVGQGFQPVSSFNYQAKKYSRVKKGLLFTMAFSFVMTLCLAVPGLAFAEDIVRLFQKSDAVIKIGAPALRYAAVGVMFSPVAVSVNMLYQSIQRSATASVLATLRSGVVLIPILMLGVHLRGLLGIQLAQPVSDVIVCLVSVPFIISFMKNTPDDE